MSVMVANASHLESILKLRRLLWPDCTEEEHQSELEAMLEGRHPMVADWPAVVMVSEEDDGVSGYMEATLRPYVDGCKEGPGDSLKDGSPKIFPMRQRCFSFSRMLSRYGPRPMVVWS